MHRRQFLQGSVNTVGSAAVLSMCPPTIRNALATDAQRETGMLQDVAHIVVLTQESA
jgi:phospholipase C